MFVKQQSSDEVVIEAPAKVNLFLEVLNRRPDGYHNINSLLQAVSLFDTVRFRTTPEAAVSIHLETDVAVPLGSDNIITKAYYLMQKRFGFGRGLDVRLAKRIPVSAGLGGGSSDGAAAIVACNLLFNLGLDSPEMATLASAVGSDVPFFFSAGQALVSGRGEIVQENDFPRNYWMVLVTLNIAVSTEVSYAELKRGLTKRRDPFRLKDCRTVEDLVRLLTLAGNDFEEARVQSLPELGRIRQELLKRGALLVRMTGSGPTMFGIFGEAPATGYGRMFNRTDWQEYIVRPISPAARE